MNEKDIIFRWAVGDIDTCSMFRFEDNEFRNYLRMTKTSILSFQAHFPKSQFYLFYNGTDFKRFKKFFDESRPSLLKKVKVCNVFDFPNPYSFTPTAGVWWKWVPFRLDIDKIEIHLDADLLCVGYPKYLMDELSRPTTNMVVATDICPEFTEWVVGNMYEIYGKNLLKGRIPINAGFLAMKPGINLAQHFYNAASEVNYDYTWQEEHIAGTKPEMSNEEDQRRRNTNFIDEQGCLNVAIYKSDIPFSILPRDTNIYGHEIFDRLNEGIEVQTCHFISGTKRIFLDFESHFFMRIYDKFYNAAAFKKDICGDDEEDTCLTSMGLGHLSDGNAYDMELFGNPYNMSMMCYPYDKAARSFAEFREWVPGSRPDKREMDWNG